MLINIPTIMDNRNTIVSGSKMAIEDTAGPGHKPTRPQPIPNNEDPNNNFLSKFLFCGNCISNPNDEDVLFFNIKKTGAVTIIAPPITKIRDASQL